MAKYKYVMNEKRIAKRIAEGRGSGEGAEFKPFLTIRDVSSRGGRSRVLGAKTGRVHHLLSDLEARAFYEMEWDDLVVDIREQVPLPRDVTRRIADGLGVRHPRIPKSDVDAVMTTDFVFDRREGEDIRRRPVFVKYECDLQNPRVQQKLKIERRYWALQGFELEEWTEERLPKVRGDNLQWLHAMHHLDDCPYPRAGHWRKRGDELLHFLRRCPQQSSISKVIDGAEKSGIFGAGEVVSLIRYLGWRKVVMIDPDRGFDARRPVSSLGVVPA